jgi:hypothetical protein
MTVPGFGTCPPVALSVPRPRHVRACLRPSTSKQSTIYGRGLLRTRTPLVNRIYGVLFFDMYTAYSLCSKLPFHVQ